jgi:uncharacterized protein YxjI
MHKEEKHMTPRLIIQQKLTAFVNKYRIYSVTDQGKTDQLISLAQQKRFKIREKVMFYTDKKRDKLSFTFRAEKIIDIHGRYFVEDPNGKVLGAFRKEFKRSLVNSTWTILDADGTERYLVKESSMVVAVLRRFIGEIPIIGELGDVIMAFFRYHFSFVDLQTGQEIGKYRKTTLFRDHYVLEATDELWNSIDWRVLAAMGVALDALQSR